MSLPGRSRPPSRPGRSSGGGGRSSSVPSPRRGGRSPCRPRLGGPDGPPATRFSMLCSFLRCSPVSIFRTRSRTSLSISRSFCSWSSLRPNSSCMGCGISVPSRQCGGCRGPSPSSGRPPCRCRVRISPCGGWAAAAVTHRATAPKARPAFSKLIIGRPLHDEMSRIRGGGPHT